MTIQTNNVNFSKGGITVAYTDNSGAAVTQNLSFANKTLSLDSGLNVTAGDTALSGALAVTGATNLNAALNVTGDSHLSSTLAVDGAVSMGSSLAIAGAMNMNNVLNVSGATHLSSTLLVDQAATMGSTLTVSGASALNSTLAVAGVANLNNVVNVAGVANMNAAMNVAGAVTMNSTLDVIAASHLHGTMLVDGAATLGSTLTVAGASVINNNLTVNGTAALNGALTLSGALNLGGSLGVTGAATMSSTLDVTGATHLSSTLLADGAATLGSTLAVTGAANLNNVLNVTGATHLSSTLLVDQALTAGGATQVNNTLGVSGAASLGSTLAVTGAVTAGNSLAVVGAATMGSTLGVTGAATMGSTLGVVGAATVGGSLGVTGVANLGNALNVTGAAALSSSLDVTGAANLNNTLAVTGAANLNSSLAVTGAANLNNTLAVVGAATFQNNVTVNGNLTVLGNQTAIDTVSLQVKDNAILIADGNTSDAIQSGIELQYKPTGEANPKYAGFKRLPVSGSTGGEFVFFKDAAAKIAEPVSAAQQAIEQAANNASMATAVSGEWFQIDMGTPTTINQLQVGSPTVNSPIDFTVFASNDNIAWDPIVHRIDYSRVIIVISPVTYRYFRYVMHTVKTYSGNGRYEFYPQFNLFNSPSQTQIGLWSAEYTNYMVTTAAKFITMTLSSNLLSIGPANSDGNSIQFATATIMYNSTYAYVGNNYTPKLPFAASSSSTDVYASIIAESFNCASDINLKNNIVVLDGALDKLDAMRGVYHDWIDENQSQDRQIGVIAQEVQSVYPELVSVGGNGFLSVNYPKLTAVLLQSIKELKAMVLALADK